MKTVVRGLSLGAREELRRFDVTQGEWRRHWFGADATRWHGDTCGCPDDRCRTFHHDEYEECGCLSATLNAYTRERREKK